MILMLEELVYIDLYQCCTIRHFLQYLR